jgi:hypothetical protein
MGNSESNNNNYTFASVDNIPYGTPPPAIPEIITKSKETAVLANQKYDPAALETCRTCLKHQNSTSKDKSERIRQQLASYLPDAPAYSEKTYKFKKENAPEIWVSSTKNSDSTVSYWLQYPLQPFHIQAGFLKSMNVPVTQDNMIKISEKYPAVYSQLLYSTKNEVSKCEQVDPLYTDTVIKSLITQGYRAYEKPLTE